MLVGIEAGVEEEEVVVDFQVEGEEHWGQTEGEEVAADVWKGEDAGKSLSQREQRLLHMLVAEVVVLRNRKDAPAEVDWEGKLEVAVNGVELN